MRVFIAGSSAFPEELETFQTSPYLLESFLYFREWQKPLIQSAKVFMLDSGAFTLRKRNGAVDWEDFIRRYGEFIDENNIDRYFEVDIDNIVGYDNVKKLTAELETITGKRCIPVWHPNRGKDEFERMCEEYDYVSLGGIAGADRTTKKKYQALFPWFIQTAHRYETEIHGLGFTSQKMIRHYHFDSVDSTSWTSGGRWGQIIQFNGQGLEIIDTSNRRIIDRHTATHHNLQEWIKFQRYAEKKLWQKGYSFTAEGWTVTSYQSCGNRT